MIVQRRSHTVFVITQPDHAALSAEIMARWRDRGLSEHPRRAAILRATREHDNGWLEVDAAPIVDPGTGALLDFMNVPAAVRRGLWPRGVERLADDPWVAALVAQHAVHVYRHYRGDAEWVPFFDRLEAIRDRHLRRAAPLTFQDLLADYFFVRMGDLLSLTFCNAWTDAPAERGYVMRFTDDRLTVSPDPFAGEAVRLAVAAREIGTDRFASAEDARLALHDAPIRHLAGVFQGLTRSTG